MNRTTQRISLLAVGTALFVALSLCLQVPVFENYYLCLGYVVMAVYCYSFGALSGTVTGAVGVVLYCLVTNGLRGMPGWALGNVVIGVGLGLAFRALRRVRSVPLRAVLSAAAIVIAVAAGILGVKSLTECVLYGQPFPVRAAKNLSAFVADTVVLIVSLPVCLSLDRTARKLFPALAVPER